MGISQSGEFDDTNSDLFRQAQITVGDTQVEAVVSGTDIFEREFVRIYNKGNRTIYFGPNGVTSSTGEPLLKSQWVEIAIRGQSVFMITDSSTADVIVTDIG